MSILANSSLALDYHENTKILTKHPFSSLPTYKVYPTARAIPLNKNNLDEALKSGDGFLQVLLSRKSTRTFTQANIDLDSLSKLLTLSCGQRNDEPDSFYRTYASAGARFPIEVYLVVLRSDDIDQGIYHYNIIDNSIELIKTGDYSDEVKGFYDNQSSIISDFPCLILFSMIPERTMQKYGERGYRFVLLDAGHMSQNLYLVATYLKLGIVSLGAGSTSDDDISDVLGLNHSEENVFYGFAVGHPQV